MSSQIQNLINTSLGDGARAAKFEAMVYVPFKSLFESDDDMATLIKTASFPGKTLDTIDIKYKGRSIPVRGQVKYIQTWEATFYLTEDHKLKNAFEKWIDGVSGVEHYNEMDSAHNLYQEMGNLEDSYTSTITIGQLNFEMNDKRIDYILHNVFPISVSQVEANYESVGQIQEFTVTFSYSHYTTIMKASNASDVSKALDAFKKDIVGAVDNVKAEISSGIVSGTKSIGASVRAGATTSAKYAEEKYNQVSGMFSSDAESE